MADLPKQDLVSRGAPGPAYVAVTQADSDTLNLQDLVSDILENRWLVLGIATFVFLIGLATAITSTPIYQADALLQIEEKESGLGELTEFNQFFYGEIPVAAEIEILRSRSLLGTVVDNLNLEIVAAPPEPSLFGAIANRLFPGDTQPRIQVSSLDATGSFADQPLIVTKTGPGAFVIESDEIEESIEGKVGEATSAVLSDGSELSIFVSQLEGEEGQEYPVQRQNRTAAIQALQSNLQVEEKGYSSGILTVTLQGPDPTMIRRTVDEIANAYVRQNVERKSAEAEQTLAFLNEQLPVVRRQVEAAEAELNAYRLEKGSIDLPLETQTLLQTIVTAESNLETLQQERLKTTQAFTESHPTVIALDRQIARMRSELESLNNQIRDLPNTQQEVLRLVRDVEVSTALYTSLLNTAQELRVMRAGTVGNVHVIDYAVQPQAPIKPNRRKIALIALALGVALGVGAALLRSALRSGVDNPDLIEKLANVPVYATVPHSNYQDQISRQSGENGKAAVLAQAHPQDAAIESLRNLRTALHFGMMGAKNRCIMIAGPSPTVGKSFVSVNLAAVLSASDRRVLLIDGDMRRGHLHEYLGMERHQGLSDYISGAMHIDDCLHQTPVPGLTLLPTGTVPPNPAELLLHDRFQELMHLLEERYDDVIIDSPPILAVTDSTIIGQVAGAAIMVLRAGQNSAHEIETSAKRLRQAGVNLRGVILNDIKQTSRYYGAGRYYYQYSYGTAAGKQ